MRRLLFYLINILLFPVTLVGYLIWVGKGIFASSKSGVSATAQGPLSARYTMDVLGVAPR